jgi:shikimate dehydrogenase
VAGARLCVVARRPEAAAGLTGETLAWDDPNWLVRARHADLIINATPLGRRGEMPLRPSALPPRGAVIDLVYARGGTPLVRRARRLGLRCVDGWAVLLAQGAAAFQAWTGLAAPVDAMREALGESTSFPSAPGDACSAGPHDPDSV